MGACRDFNGSTSAIEFGTASTFEGVSEITIMSWINTDNNTRNSGFNTKWSSTKKPIFLIEEANKIACTIGDGDTAKQRNNLSDSSFSSLVANTTWTHIAATNSLTSTSVQKMFVDGVEKASTINLDNTIETSIQNNAAPYTTGALGSVGSLTYPYNGRLCYSAIYDSLLTVDAILEVQYNPFSFVAKSLIPHWDSGSTETELGNGLTGTVTNATENFDGPPVFLLGGQ